MCNKGGKAKHRIWHILNIAVGRPRRMGFSNPPLHLRKASRSAFFGVTQSSNMGHVLRGCAAFTNKYFTEISRRYWISFFH